MKSLLQTPDQAIRQKKLPNATRIAFSTSNGMLILRTPEILPLKKHETISSFRLIQTNGLKKVDCSQLLDFSNNHSTDIGRIEILNLQADQTFQREHVSRIFNRKNFRFEGSVHEQIVSTSHADRSMVELNVSIIHSGYADERPNQKKAKTYREMIEKKLKENPNDSYLLYQLGRTFEIQQDFVNAAEAYLKSLRTSPRHDLEYFRSVL